MTLNDSYFMDYIPTVCIMFTVFHDVLKSITHLSQMIPFVSYKDPSPSFDIKYVGFTTSDSSGEWIVYGKLFHNVKYICCQKIHFFFYFRSISRLLDAIIIYQIQSMKTLRCIIQRQMTGTCCFILLITEDRISSHDVRSTCAESLCCVCVPRSGLYERL